MRAALGLAPSSPSRVSARDAARCGQREAGAGGVDGARDADVGSLDGVVVVVALVGVREFDIDGEDEGVSLDAAPVDPDVALRVLYDLWRTQRVGRARPGAAPKFGALERGPNLETGDERGGSSRS